MPLSDVGTSICSISQSGYQSVTLGTNTNTPEDSPYWPTMPKQYSDNGLQDTSAHPVFVRKQRFQQYRTQSCFLPTPFGLRENILLRVNGVLANITEEFSLLQLSSHFLTRIVRWINAEDKRSAFATPPATKVDALRLSTLRMSKAQGMSYLFGSGLSGLDLYWSSKKKCHSEKWPKSLNHLVGRARFELATNGLKVRCSTG